MPDGTDVLAIDPTDTEAMAALVAVLHRHLTPEQCRQFIRDLNAWERRLGKAGRATVTAYARMCERRAFTPCIVRAMADLADTPEWREIEQWRNHIRDVTGKERAA